MGSFNKQGFVARSTTMGDEAEAVFERAYPQKWVRFGINRPPINVKLVPPFVRYAPDYLTSKGLVEVQGFGRDQIAKFKLGKLEALTEWNDKFRVDFFLWDSSNQRYGWVRLAELDEALIAHGSAMTFHEGNPYTALRADCIPVVDGWVPLGEPLAAER